ncbi:hypothetical protein FQN49_006626 [Arthroderma sp. PD_2]|nr:hypothetical protein FQN49_006626 [Arthroderma sp. PD_2]
MPLRQAATRRSSRVASSTRQSAEPDKIDTPRKRETAVMVAIPVKDTSSFRSMSSSSSPSAGESTGGDTANAYSTPATTVNATPNNESESSSRPRRVNAAARAQELRNSSLGLNGRKRTAPAARNAKQSQPDPVDDAKLAAALQAEEYNAGPTVKKQKMNNGGPSTMRVLSDSEDEDEEWSTDEAFAEPDTERIPGEPRNNKKNLWELETDSGLDDLLSSLSGLSDISDSASIDSTDTEIDDIMRILGESTRRRMAAGSQRRTTRRKPPGPRLTRAEKERKKLETQHPEIIDMWEKLEDTPILAPPAAAQPEGINRKLKPFQLEGLSWMRAQEESEWRGGLLGDEMGMGKTIQAVSLLMSDYPVGLPSLVVVPPVALMQWQAEIDSYTDGKLKVFIYHAANTKVKNITAKELKTYDVIMVSYSGLESMHRKEVKGWKRDGGLVKGTSMLHSIDFHRLILDEAHNIKQRTTSVARACFALKSKYKWCLSGTPVQNRIGEFFSLLRFLEVQPFACYFCKSCKCQALHWSQDVQKKCTLCKHSHVSVFNQEILNPITEGRFNVTKRKEALDKLRLITDRIMLRRVKKDHTSSMELPPKRVEIHREYFGEIEQDFSQSIMTNTSRQFDRYVSRGVMLNNYANIFGLIMQMRQVANHPDLILKKHSEGGQNILVCCICDEPAEEAIRSRCRHEFCRQCAKEYMASVQYGSEPDCPRCHLPLSIDFEQPDIEQDESGVKKNSIINRIKMENWTSSTKIEMLVYDLYKLRSKKKTNKSIVFSQFTSMLQLVEWRLHRAGISTVMLDGSMTPVQRQRSIDYFMNNVDTEVFLVSLKAGGVALNLTEASRVFIVDPWWNPAAEWQSADRCHRIGQRRPCVITRLCIEDSVESRMVLLQEKKANMINGTINKDQSEALEKLTPEDMHNIQALLATLADQECAKHLHSRIDNHKLAADLEVIALQAGQPGFDYLDCRPLFEAVIQREPAIRLLTAAIDLTLKASPIICRQTEMQSPEERSSAHIELDRSSYRRYETQVLRQELGPVYVDVFMYNYVGSEGGPNLGTATKTVLDKFIQKGDLIRYRDVVGKWRQWPQDASAETVLSWLNLIIGQVIQFSETCQGVQGRDNHPPRRLPEIVKIVGRRTADEKLDVAFVEDQNSQTDWEIPLAKILIPGVIHRKTSADKSPSAWLDIGRCAKHTFATQDTRRFVFGFTLCGDVMRLWRFDRLGVVAGSAFNINAKGGQFISALLTCLWMDEERLGFDTSIATARGERYFYAECGIQVFLDNLIGRSSLVEGRGTTCWKGHLGNDSSKQCVIKDSWQSPDQPIEGELLQLATDKGVVNVARHYDHMTIKVNRKDSDVVETIRKAGYKIRATEVTASSCIDKSPTPNEPIQPTQISALPECSRPHTENRVHRRVVIRDYGKPIYQATSIMALLGALEACIEGHMSLLEKTGILHRDISLGNLIINEETGNPSWPAFLIDLSHATPIQERGSSTTGGEPDTGPFTSIGVLRGDQHSFMDDLESFFWVLYWICVHYEAPGKRRTVPRYDKWNNMNADELALVKQGIISDESDFLRRVGEHFTPYYQPLVYWVNRLRRAVFPTRIRQRAMNSGLYSDMKSILQEAQKDPDVKGQM